MDSIEEVRSAVVAVATGAAANVVAVGRGSGTVLRPGVVLTNAHNLPGERVPVRFGDGRLAEGTVAAADTDGDLAVVSVDTGELPGVRWAEDPPSIGTVVLAAAPTRSGSPRVTVGLVSADGQAFRGPRGSRIHGAIEHTAPLGRGSSGGPIVDVDGALLGINTHRRGEGFYLARPVGAALREQVDALARGETPRTWRLGVAIAPSHVAGRLRAAVGLEPRDGVLVREVEPASPADRAGVRAGDLVVGAGGVPIASPEDLRDQVRAATDHLELSIVRGVEELVLRVTVEDELEDEAEGGEEA